jgi:predicted nucleic acid-binding protein
MFLVDTNVLSELRRRARTHPNVAAWADGVPVLDMFVSAITIMELQWGALMLQQRDLARGDMLLEWIDLEVLPTFEGRILPVDTKVARRCARLHVPVRSPERDALIAASALIYGFAMVTRNVRDFQPMGVEVINPWDTPA